jgi:hypothetical protein
MSFNLHTVILESFDFCLQFVGHNLALSDSFWQLTNLSKCNPGQQEFLWHLNFPFVTILAKKLALSNNFWSKTYQSLQV